MVLLPEIFWYREAPIPSIAQCSCGVASQSVDARCALTCAELSKMTDAHRPKSRNSYRFDDRGSRRIKALKLSVL
jgi:hypothetical protein